MSKSELFSIKDKVIIITGGIGFLGRQYSLALGKAGARIVIWDNASLKEIKNFEKLLKKDKIEYLLMKVDITDEPVVRKAVKAVIGKFGTIDALVNNAAINPAVGSEEVKKLFVPYEDYPIDLFEQELRVNTTGTMICIKAVAPMMMKNKKGSIVNVASEISIIAHDHRVYNDPQKFKSPGYAASKTAILGLTRQWAARLGSYNVRVNSFSPGGVRNEKMPVDFVERFGKTTMLGRMAEQNEYIGPITFLCSDASSFMTGANLTVDGGKSAW